MTTLLFIVINSFAGFFQGVVGFGQGLVASPLSLALFNKNSVLTALLISGTILNISLYPQIKAPLDKKLFNPLIIGSIIGLPVGVLILKLLPAPTLKISVGLLSIGLTLLLLFAKIKLSRPERYASSIGFLAGALQTSVAIPGPPVVLFLSSTSLPKDEMRKLLILFFIWTGVFGLPAYILGHVLTWQGVWFALVSTPFILLAGYLGHRVAKFVPHQWYRTIALVTIFLSSAYAVYNGLK